MKRIHIYLLTAMALLNSSCSADWLDLNTTSSVETGQAIVTLDDAQIALNGIYRLASGHKLLRRQLLVLRRLPCRRCTGTYHQRRRKTRISLL